MFKLKVLTLAFLCSFISYAQVPTLEWVSISTGPNMVKGVDIEIDENEKVYVAGNFKQVTDFDPGPSTYYLNPLAGIDIFFQKLDLDGSLVWAYSTGQIHSTPVTYDWDRANTIDKTSDGNYILTGYFTGTADFDFSSNNSFLQTNNEFRDIFIVKIDEHGSLIWAKNIEGQGRETPYEVNVDEFDNIMISGLFSDTLDADPGPGVFELYPNNHFNSGNAFLIKLNSAGDLIWANAWENSYNFDWSPVFTYDNEGSTILTEKLHYSEDTLDVDPGPGVNLINHPAGYGPHVIMKVDSNGILDWYGEFIGGALTFIGDVTTDSEQNIIICGYFSDTIDLDPGPGQHIMVSNHWNDCFVLKLNKNGDFVWAVQFGGDGAGAIAGDQATQLTTDEFNNIVITGNFSDTVDFNPGLGVYNLVSNSVPSLDGYVLKLDANGDFMYAFITSGTGYVRYSDIEIQNEKLYLTGYFKNTVGFDPYDSTMIHSAWPGGASVDHFVAKYNESGQTSFIDSEDQNSFKIYPVPTKNSVFIESQNFIDMISLLDLSGRQIKSEYVQSNSFELSTAELKDGVYMIKLHCKGQTYTERIVIAN